MIRRAGLLHLIWVGTRYVEQPRTGPVPPQVRVVLGWVERRVLVPDICASRRPPLNKGRQVSCPSCCRLVSTLAAVPTFHDYAYKMSKTYYNTII